MILFVLFAQQHLLLLHVGTELRVISTAAILAVERARSGVVLMLVWRHGGAHGVVGCRGRGRGGRAGHRGCEMRLLVHLGHGHCFVVVGIDDAGGWRRGGSSRGGSVNGHWRRRGSWFRRGGVLVRVSVAFISQGREWWCLFQVCSAANRRVSHEFFAKLAMSL